MRWWLVFISPSVHPEFCVSLLGCTTENLMEGDSYMRLLETKEITTEAVPKTQR